jgi:hypothetical protein
MAKKRIALDPKVSSDDVDNAAWELDWPITGTLEKTEDRPKQDVYRGDEDGTKVYLIHDDALQLRYLYIDGPSAAKVAEAARGELDTVSAKDAEQRFKDAGSADERATAILLLGVASDDGTLPGVLETATEDALGLVESADAKRLLKAIAEDDEDEVVRGDAEATLKELA